MTPAPRGLLQGYFWEPASQRYKYARTGRYVARNKIVGLLERSVAGRERRLMAGTSRLAAGEISPATWLSRTRTMVKRQHLQNEALAAGGWDRLTQADYGRVGGRLQAEYRRIGDLAGQIARGEVSEAQALNRVHMYMGNARRAYFDVERERLPPAEVGKVRVEKRVLAARDGANCPKCLEHAGEGWQLEGILPVPTEDCQCLPGDAPVVADGIIRAFKRWYVGDLVEVATSGGHKLSATPNHPVATPTGWIAIGALHEGDQIIHDRRVERMAGSDPDVVNVPTPIGEVYRALALAGDVKWMASLPVDFHGDGRDQEVYVVWANDRLPDGAESARGEGVLDLLFPIPVGAEMGGARLVTSGLLGSHVNGSKFARAPEGNVLLGEDTLQCIGGCVVMSAYAAHGFAGSVGLGDLSARQTGDPGCGAGFVDDRGLPIAPDLHAYTQQAPADGNPANSVSFGERKFGFTRFVTAGDLFDRQNDPGFDTVSVISVHKSPFVGYVYNLTTTRGYYTINGAILQNCDGNCRCSLLRKEVPAEQMGQWVGNKTRKEIAA